jgi:hypothetical protein
MNVKVEHEWQRDGFAVWIFRRGPGTIRLLQQGEGPFSERWEDHPSEADAPLEPTFRIPAEAAEELVRELSKLKPPSEAQAVHLADARAERERMAGWLERLLFPELPDGEKVRPIRPA